MLVEDKNRLIIVKDNKGNKYFFNGLKEETPEERVKRIYLSGGK